MRITDGISLVLLQRIYVLRLRSSPQYLRISLAARSGPIRQMKHDQMAVAAGRVLSTRNSSLRCKITEGGGGLQKRKSVLLKKGQALYVGV